MSLRERTGLCFIKDKETMNRKTYLLWLFILSMGYLSNVHTAQFLQRDYMFVFVALYGLYGFYKYPYKGINPLYTPKNTKWAWWLLGIMIVSLFIPFVTYGQSIISTFFSQRFNYYILFFLVFLKIRPKWHEMEYVIKICAYLSLIAYIITIIYPQFYVSQSVLNEIMQHRAENGSTDIGLGAPGWGIAILYFFVLCNKMQYNPKISDIIAVTVFLLYIIAFQNRSTLIGTIPFYIWGIYKMKSPKKTFYITLSLSSVIFLMPFLTMIYDSLINETEQQLGDENYNRWQAIVFLLFEMKSNIFDYILGNGLWTTSGTYLSNILVAQTSRGVYISDIGLFGTFFYYGIVPLFIMYRFCYIAIKDKRIPSFLKYYSIFIILVPTIQSFLLLNERTNIIYALFFYLIIFFQQKDGISTNCLKKNMCPLSNGNTNLY